MLTPKSAAGVMVEPAQKKEKKMTPIQTTQIQNSTSVEFDIKIPYTVPSDGKSYAVEMEEYSIPAIYEYYAIPKLDKDAFLTAKILDWEDLNLLTGEANLFFEDTYVGKSLLNANGKEDTLKLSLGRDKNIIISRTLGHNFTKSQFIGSNRKELKVWEINVRNKKSLPIDIIIEDQIPVASIKEVQVESKELSGAELEKDTGKLTWKLNLKPAQNKKIDLKYEVKYPKDLKIVVD